MSALPVRYSEAVKALAACLRVDEVRKIRNQHAALAEYARQACDIELIGPATEIKMRAERRAGELLKVMQQTGERAKPGDGRSQKTRKLVDLKLTTVTSSRWQALAELPQDEFEQRVAQASARAVSVLENGRGFVKKQERERREVALAAKLKALPDKLYGVFYVDPPWKFEVRDDETGNDRGAVNHYPTMTIDALKKWAITMQRLVPSTCGLFMWATVPHLVQALELMMVMGFEYKSQLVWVKDKIGLGYWFRGQHELLLVGTRGDFPAPQSGERIASVLRAPRREHSRKPDEIAAWIESCYPNLPKIELFARHARDGWDAWGYEASEAGADLPVECLMSIVDCVPAPPSMTFPDAIGQGATADERYDQVMAPPAPHAQPPVTAADVGIRFNAQGQPEMHEVPASDADFVWNDRTGMSKWD